MILDSSGQSQSLSLPSMLVNKCKDLLFLLHAVLAPNGAEEDLGPVEDVRRKPSPLQTLSQPAANNLLACLDIVRLVGVVEQDRFHLLLL